MEWSKIKNIVLLMLLTVNVFLLVLVAYRQERSAQYTARAWADAVGVLTRNGITVDESSLPRDISLARLSVARDKTAEANAAAALLGTDAETGQGGGTVYTGEKGTLRFSRSGDFSASFAAGAYPLGEKTASEHALETLALLDFDGQVLSAEERDGQTEVTVRQLWQGTPVFDCTATLVYEGDELRLIRDGSCRLTGTPAAESEAEPLSVVTGLIRFLEGINKLGDVCTALTGMTPGYTCSSGLTDPVTLCPVWYITTDTGAYYLNTCTGVLERAGTAF